MFYPLFKDKFPQARGVLGFRFGGKKPLLKLIDNFGAIGGVEDSGIEGKVIVARILPVNVKKIAVKAGAALVAGLDNLARPPFIALK
jgi:hypothetical protein